MIRIRWGNYVTSVEALAWMVITLICVVRSWASYRQAATERAVELHQPKPSRTRLKLARMAIRREVTRVWQATAFAMMGAVSFASSREPQRPVTVFGIIFEVIMFGVLFRLWWTIEMDKRDDRDLTAWYAVDNDRNLYRRSDDPPTPRA